VPPERARSGAAAAGWPARGGEGARARDRVPRMLARSASQPAGQAIRLGEAALAAHFTHRRVQPSPASLAALSPTAQRCPTSTVRTGCVGMILPLSFHRGMLIGVEMLMEPCAGKRPPGESRSMRVFVVPVHRNRIITESLRDVDRDENVDEAVSWETTPRGKWLDASSGVPVHRNRIIPEHPCPPRRTPARTRRRTTVRFEIRI